MGQMICVLGLDSQRGPGIFLYSTASRPTLGPTQPPIQWVQVGLPTVVERPGREADHSPPSSVELKMRGAIPPPPIRLHGVVLRKAQEQIYVYWLTYTETTKQTNKQTNKNYVTIQFNIKWPHYLVQWLRMTTIKDEVKISNSDRSVKLTISWLQVAVHITYIPWITNSMQQQSPSCEANSHSTSQEIPCLL
jgi:hypothetical protein